MFHDLQVFSDEFEVDGRTFHDGYDSRWTAINKNDCKFFFQRIKLDPDQQFGNQSI